MTESVGDSAGEPRSSPAAGAKTAGAKLFFTRRELDQILWLYGRMVAAGEWRDYAMDALADRAVFSIYRRASENPLYQIEKRPDLARRQGAFAVFGAQGQVLKRGHDLALVLRALEPKRLQAVEP